MMGPGLGWIPVHMAPAGGEWLCEWYGDGVGAGDGQEDGHVLRVGGRERGADGHGLG